MIFALSALLICLSFWLYMGIVRFKGLPLTHCFLLLTYVLYVCCVQIPRGDGMPKVRLFVRVRKQGARIDSVPLKALVQLSGCRKRRWSYEDGWLILEGF